MEQKTEKRNRMNIMFAEQNLRNTIYKTKQNIKQRTYLEHNKIKQEKIGNCQAKKTKSQRIEAPQKNI